MTLELAEALLVVGELRREEISELAVGLLESGTDAPTVRVLASLSGGDLSEAHGLFCRMLREMGRELPSRYAAGSTIARHLASRVVEGDEDLPAIAGYGARLAVALEYHDALMPFYVADDKYGCPGMWLRADVDHELLQRARDLLSGAQNAV